MRVGILIHISVLLSVFSVSLSGRLVVRRESSSVLRKHTNRICSLGRFVGGDRRMYGLQKRNVDRKHLNAILLL